MNKKPASKKPEKKSWTRRFIDWTWRRSKSPDFADVLGTLLKGVIARADVEAMLREQKRIEDDRSKRERLYDQLSVTAYEDPEFGRILKRLDRLY
jgi:hypothetical protein